MTTPTRRRRRSRQNNRRNSSYRDVPLPSWNHLCRLSTEASDLVQQQGHSRNPVTLFLAMIAILTCEQATAFPVPHSPPSTHQTLWAYVPDPPVLRPVTWDDPAFPVYINDTSIFGFPSSSHITPQLANYTYTAQAIAPPMCFYASFIYDKFSYSDYVSLQPSPPPPIPGNFCFPLGVKQLQTYNGPHTLFPGESVSKRDWTLFYPSIRESPNICSPDFPFMERQLCHSDNTPFDPSPPWQLCYPNQKQALYYTLPSGFTLYDWSIPNPSHEDLTRYEMPGGWSTPIFTTDKGTTYTSLWKLFLSLCPSYYFAGSHSRAYPGKGYIYIQSCVASPYAILLGNVSFSENNGHYLISCINCTLTNCIDSSMFPTSTILIVHQPPYVLLPVNISGNWYDERALQIFHKVHELLLRPKRFIGIFITSIIAIVSVVATAATAAVSLAHSVQTASYVNHLAKNISVTMGTQMDIEKKLRLNSML